jgi:hypothetical protein
MKKMNPKQAISARCKDCSPEKNDNAHCTDECYLRNKENRKRLNSIKRYCANFCMNGSRKEVELCTSPECSLYPYRMGQNPNMKGGIGNSKWVKKSPTE